MNHFRACVAVMEPKLAAQVHWSMTADLTSASARGHHAAFHRDALLKDGESCLRRCGLAGCWR